MNLSADDNLLHVAINAKLAEVVDESPTTPAWRDAWRQLGPESTNEERLAVYQAVRDSGDLPAEGGFYLVSWQVDAIAWRRSKRCMAATMTATGRRGLLPQSMTNSWNAATTNGTPCSSARSTKSANARWRSYSRQIVQGLRN
jgi:hypothetical protein